MSPTPDSQDFYYTLRKAIERVNNGYTKQRRGEDERWGDKEFLRGILFGGTPGGIDYDNLPSQDSEHSHLNRLLMRAAKNHPNGLYDEANDYLSGYASGDEDGLLAETLNGLFSEIIGSIKEGRKPPFGGGFSGGGGASSR